MEIACFVVLVWVRGLSAFVAPPPPSLSSTYSVHAVLIDESDIKLTICLTTITVNLKIYIPPVPTPGYYYY